MIKIYNDLDNKFQNFHFKISYNIIYIYLILLQYYLNITHYFYYIMI
jgi:hypothetical protein